MSLNTQINKTPVQLVEITENNRQQRIDNFLITHLKGAPKSLIYRIIRKGEVRVNKKRAKPDYRLSLGDIVRIPPINLSAPREIPTINYAWAAKLETAIIYEDKDIIAVNKPSGLAVHGGSGISLGLIESLRQLRSESNFLELVHRLDRDTSGCILIAKKRSVLKHLHQALQNKEINKIYHALVIGNWDKKNTKIDAPLKKNELKSGERIVKVMSNGKASLTNYRVLERFSSFATLIEARPITGRTHQIRVHCQFAGCPIFGDDKYATDEINRLGQQQGISRLFLHAASLHFPLLSGEYRTVNATLDKQLQKVILNLRNTYS